MNNKSSIINNPVDFAETINTDREVKVRSFRIRAQSSLNPRPAH
jgi:hypothetical protein